MRLPPIPPDWIDPGRLDRAAALQRMLAERVVATGEPPAIRRVAGVDVSCRPRDPAAPVHAAAVALDAQTLAATASASAGLAPRFPYVSGFLAFREIPAVLEALARLPGGAPDLLVVDGHGIAHPRSLGIAAHLGVLLDRPAIGVGKTLLAGTPVGAIPAEPGGRADLCRHGRVVGAALRTRRGANPVYVSVGHRIGLDEAVAWVLRLSRGYRLPEPMRLAHLAANEARRAAEATADTAAASGIAD